MLISFWLCLFVILKKFSKEVFQRIITLQKLNLLVCMPYKENRFLVAKYISYIKQTLANNHNTHGANTGLVFFLQKISSHVHIISTILSKIFKYSFKYYIALFISMYKETVL